MIAKQLEDIDIAMLFLNAGCVERGLFTNLLPFEI